MRALHREQGSTLISVLFVVLVVAVMMSGLLVASAEGIQASQREQLQSQALADARSGILVAYQQLKQEWQNLSPTGQFKTIADAQQALETLKTNIQSWLTTANFPTSIRVQVTFDNLSFANMKPDQPGQLVQPIIIQSTGVRSGVTETLESTTSISGVVEALNYAIYSTGNLVIAGPPRIAGNVAVQNATYVSAQPWVPNLDPNYTNRSSFNTIFIDYYMPLFKFQVKLACGVVHVPETSDMEPQISPSLNGTMYTKNGLYTFSGFSDQNQHSTFTAEFGTQFSGTAFVPSSDTRHVINGEVSYTSVSPAFSTDVASIVGNYKTSISGQAQKLGRYHSFQQHGGYVDASVDLPWYSTPSVDGPLYIEGDLVVPPTCVLTVNQPLFVDGDLVVSGTIVGQAAIYVSGNTYYEPIDLFQPGSGLLGILNPVSGKTPRLEIFSIGPILLTLQNWSSALPSTPVTMHAFLASADTVYLDGTTGYYDIKGGVIGKNVFITAVAGSAQSTKLAGTDGAWLVAWPLIQLYSKNKNDTSPRLTIEYDNSFVTNPLVGTPTVNQLQVQGLSQPVKVDN